MDTFLSNETILPQDPYIISEPNHSEHIHLYNFSNNDDQFTTILHRVVTPLLLGIITLTGIIGNGLVIYVLTQNKVFLSTTNVLLLNLAGVDILFSIICPPYTAYSYAEYANWIITGQIGNCLCKTIHYILNVIAYVTIYTMVVIVMTRYMIIVHYTHTIYFQAKRE